MSVFFLFSNIHFAQELFGALVFSICAWLAFDAFLIRRDFLTVSRGLGFVILAIAQIVRGIGLSIAGYEYLEHGIYVVGLLFLLLNLVLEKPVDRPSLKSLKGFVLGPAGFMSLYGHHAMAILYFGVAALSYAQYRKETKKALGPFWAGFLFLSFGALAAVFYEVDELTPLWLLGQIFEIIGFISLAVWVWQYLTARLREEIVLIFTSLALFISIAVTLAFSIILMGQVEEATRVNLVTNTRVLDFTIERLKHESLAKAKLIAVNPDVEKAMLGNDFPALQEIAGRLVKEESLGFLTFVDQDGIAVLRAHALTRRDDRLSSEEAVGSALRGTPLVTIESKTFEKLSLRAAAPMYHEGTLIGAVVLGTPLDVPFVDSLKKITGLDVTLFDKDVIAASTIIGPDNRSTISDIKLADTAPKDHVLEKGESLTLRTDLLARSYLMSYIPMKNSSGKIIGMLSAGRSQEEISDIATRTNILTLLTVGAIMLILIFPLYLITRRLGEE